MKAISPISLIGVKLISFVSRQTPVVCSELCPSWSFCSNTRGIPLSGFSVGFAAAAPDGAKGSLLCHIGFGGSILPIVSEAEAREA